MSPRPGVAVPDLQQLRDRVRTLERPTPGVELARGRSVAALPVLRGGSSVEVSDLGLAMALLGGPTSAGSWCAVVGVPDFGAEAAAGLGVDLARVVLVPRPAEQWLEVVAALVDVVSLVLLRPPERVSDGTAARLSARLRRRDAVLLVQGESGAWPRCELRLRTTRTAWSGVGEGHGRLRVRDLEVQVREGARPPRLVPVRLGPAGPLVTGSRDAVDTTAARGPGHDQVWEAG
ncbi:hypothetical protein [Nocardioides marmoraquaticus]